MIAKDIPVEFKWKKSLFWDDNISVELIREENGKIGPYEKQTGNFTFYSDKTGKILSKMSAESYWQNRAYVKDIDRLKAGDGSVIEGLIRKIEMMDIMQKQLENPRKSLIVTKEELIKSIKEGEIPEKKLDDFFSLWDKL